MAWIQPAGPGGQFAPPLPYPDGVPPPPGAVIVGYGAIPPAPPGLPNLPGYQPGPGFAGMLPAPPPLPGFFPGFPSPMPNVEGAAAAGAAGAMLGPFSVFAGVPLFVLILGVILAAFLLFLFLNPFIKALVSGTTSLTSCFALFVPLLLIGGLVLLLACNGGGGGTSWVLFGALAIMVLIFLPLFGLFPTLLTP